MRSLSAPEVTTETAGATSVAPAKRRATGLSGSTWEPYLYLLPGLLIFTLFVVVPVLGTLVISLTAWNGIAWAQATFVGVENYVAAMTDPLFWGAFWNNLLLIPFFVLLPAVLGLIPAAIVHQLKVRGAPGFQAGLFLPYIMPGVLIGVVWRWLLNPVFGPVNAGLERVGLPTPAWLGDFTLALPTVGMIGAWAAYGFCFVIFLAGMQKIQSDLYEAARLDGANTLQEFTAVTLPGLRREIAVVLSVNLINALRAFDVIRSTTDGGPGRETEVVAIYMIDVAFGAKAVGYGAAIAVLLAVTTLILSLLVLRLFGDRDG